MNLETIVGNYLIEAGNKILNGTCSMTNDEIMKLASSIMHEEMNKTEASEFLNMSTRTFDRKIENKELPEGKHVRGSKNLIWYKDELCLQATTHAPI